MVGTLDAVPWAIGGAAAGDFTSDMIPGDFSPTAKDALGIIGGAGVGAGVAFGLDKAGISDAVSAGVGGGVMAGGTTAAIRERLDVADDGSQRTLVGDPGTVLGTATMPSVAWGVGTGVVSLGLWWADVSGMMTTAPMDLEELWLGYGLGGVAAGTASAALPKQAAGTASGSASGQTRTLKEAASGGGGGGGGGGNTSGNGEFQAAQ